MSYIYIYYTTAMLSVMLLPVLYRDSRGDVELVGIRWMFGALLMCSYLIGMSRIGGVDQATYLHYFNVGGVPDRGFQGLIDIFKYFSFPYNSIIFFVGCVTLFSAYRVAKHYKVSFIFLLVLLFLHLIVVRDFAQLRIGLAISLALIGITLSVRWKSLIYILSVSMQLSAIAFIAAYEACVFISKVKDQKIRITLISFGAAFICLVGLFLNDIDFLDDRISIYLQWDKTGYGKPVEHYGMLIFSSLIIGASLITRRTWHSDKKVRTLFYLQLLGVVTFVSFRDSAIFAFRITNAVVSLYPVFILILLQRYSYYPNNFLPKRVVTRIMLLVIIVALLLRSESFSIIKQIAL